MNKQHLQLPLLSIGQQMALMVEKAIGIIREESHDLVVEDKVGYDNVKWDCVTAGDRRAQEMYLKEIVMHFPTFGVIAEEKELTIPCTDANFDVYFTIDPLDGTKAYARKQSHGVSTMLALVCDGKIVAVTIGDANTGEIYSYADEDARGEVARWRFDKMEKLEPDVVRPLHQQYVLLLDNPRVQPEVVKDMATLFPAEGGLFKDFEIQGGSIGLRFARLWKGEIGGIILSPTHDTPWDLMPVLGISKRLGFKFFGLDPATNTFTEREPELTKVIVKKPFVELIIHETHVPEFKAWLTANS